MRVVAERVEFVCRQELVLEHALREVDVAPLSEREQYPDGSEYCFHGGYRAPRVPELRRDEQGRPNRPACPSARRPACGSALRSATGS